MDLATKALCNEGDTVICEAPSFIGSLNCFRSYNAKLRGIPVQADGMDVDELERALQEEKRMSGLSIRSRIFKIRRALPCRLPSAAGSTSSQNNTAC